MLNLLNACPSMMWLQSDNGFTPFIIFIIIGVFVVLIIFLVGIRIGRNNILPKLEQAYRDLEEIKLAKSADERLIAKLEEQIDELRWRLRRGDK